jgi:flagellar FliJ protein
MLRSERLEPVLDLAAEAERKAALAVADAEARVAEAERKLAELERYEQEYRTALRQQSAAGIGASQLRAFHSFIGRLGEAIFQQGVVVTRAREERERLRAHWVEATRRTRAVGKAVEHAEHDERHQRERREQADMDERAQRSFIATVLARRESISTGTGEEP